LPQVPSNSKVALAVLNRVYKKLQTQNILTEYDEIFQNQLKDGIIEQIFVKPDHYQDYIWIPHRVVLKMSEHCTTKIRTVFNCSLKIGDAPSLNQAAHIKA
jgi:hypothetical protein